MFKKVLFFILSFALFSFAFGDNSLTFTQTKIKEWDNGNHVQWEVVIVNTDPSNRTITDALIIGNENFKPDGTWNLEITQDNKYHLPSYINQHGLKFGSNHTFGFINTINSQVTFTASDIKY
ncbi:hypothetical protein ACTFIZ_006195 [Dictyostelium cf. discoideum]